MRLEKLPMELLILLVQHPGELVTREQIAEQLWGKGVFLDVENGINTAVRKVRLVLGDGPEKPRFIETVVGKGYRFAAPVSSNGNASTLAPAAAANAASAPTPAAAPTAQRTVSYIAPILRASTALLAMAIVGFFLYQHRAARRPATIRAIAVLPLKNLSADSSQEYLADGMTEALISRLSAIHDLRVISRTTAMRYKDTKLSVPDIAKVLQVDAVVEGSVTREGERIRVTAQLIRGATDMHFWSETFDRDLPDVLALQSDIAQAIARKIEATVTGTEGERLAAAPHVLPEAYENYLKGRFKMEQANSRSDIEESTRYFENAIRLDSKFAPAYLGLASAHMDLGTIIIGLDPENQRLEAAKAARKALELDPDLSDGHAILADIEQKQWHWAQAEAEYRRALQLNPNDASAHAGLASWLLCQGRMEEALSSALRARELDRSGFSTYTVAWILFHARRYDDEIRELRSAMAVYPHDRQLLWDLGFALMMKGEPEQAIPALEQAALLANRSSGTLDLLTAAYARAGRRRDALRILEELKVRQKTRYVPAGSFVIAYLGLGDNEQAFTWLEEAYKERSNLLQFVKVHPLFDPLRNDPRFEDLVRRIGL